MNVKSFRFAQEFGKSVHKGHFERISHNLSTNCHCNFLRGLIRCMKRECGRDPEDAALHRNGF